VFGRSLGWTEPASLAKGDCARILEATASVLRQEIRNADIEKTASEQLEL
jgi:hypothetical protein